MMTQKRFRAMADSYGADLRRWPAKDRVSAEELLIHSADARFWLASARQLDDSVAHARGLDVTCFEGGEEAALMRLRLGVEVKIAGQRRRHREPWSTMGWLPNSPTRWLGMATGGGIAIMAGLLIGLTYTSSPASTGSDALMSMLQPAPINALGDSGV